MIKPNTCIRANSSTKIEFFLVPVSPAMVGQPNQPIQAKRDNRKWGGLGGPEHFFHLLGGQANSPTHLDHFYPYLHEEAGPWEPTVQENLKNSSKIPYHSSFRFL